MVEVKLLELLSHCNKFIAEIKEDYLGQPLSAQQCEYFATVVLLNG